MSASVAILDAMSKLSRSMVDAAIANDWDTLAGLEAQLSARRRELERLEPGGKQAEALSEQQQRHKAALIQTLLDDANTISLHVTPWMESTRTLLAAGTRDRAVKKAYGGQSA